MQVTSISLVHYLNNNQPYHIDSTDSVKKFSHRNGDFAPSYYKDFNINLNFNGRSPEDFYDQDFNKKNMPKTMSEYLYSDFSDRHHLPPVQLMNEAFDFLSVAATVDDIKELYPNEPLFNQLKPANYYAATRGVLRKIGEIKKECLNEGVKPESLFKDGSDDLTAYIVKKIFLEGKTVNEIDKDFENDLNGLYKGVIKSISSQTSKQLKDGESKYFSNSTTYSLGIRFPQISFWNSLINTRDDYEHVGRYKVNGRFVNTSESGFEPNELTKVLDVIDEKPVKKIKLNQHKVKQITDAIVDGNGDVKKIKHNIHKRAKGTQELSFVQRYWSEIMSVATEKVHLSEELSYFYAKLEKSNSLNLSVDKNDALEDFVNGDNLSDRETDLLKRFWNFHSNDDLKDNFSMAISSTIKEFSEAYNDNGYSEEFEIMIDYAHSLKPQRERAKLLHDEIQKEYEQLGEYLSSLDNDDLEIDLQETESPVKNIKMYHFDIGNGVIIPSDINIVELFEKDFKSDSALLPSQYLNAYLNDFKDYLKTDTEYNRFVVSAAFDPILIPNKYKQYLYSEDEVISITKEVSINGKKHSNNDVYASIAFWDYCIKHDIMSPDELLNADGNKKFFNLFKLASDIYKDKFYENPIEFQNAKNDSIFTFQNAKMCIKCRT